MKNSNYLTLKFWYPIHLTDDVEGHCVIAFYEGDDVVFHRKGFKCHKDDVEKNLATTTEDLYKEYKKEILEAPKSIDAETILECYSKWNVGWD